MQTKMSTAKGNRLSYYGSGKYKGYNTVFDTENYAVGVPSTGNSLNIFVKQDEVEDGVLPAFGYFTDDSWLWHEIYR